MKHLAFDTSVYNPSAVMTILYNIKSNLESSIWMSCIDKGCVLINEWCVIIAFIFYP